MTKRKYLFTLLIPHFYLSLFFKFSYSFDLQERTCWNFLYAGNWRARRRKGTIKYGAADAQEQVTFLHNVNSCLCKQTIHQIPLPFFLLICNYSSFHLIYNYLFFPFAPQLTLFPQLSKSKKLHVFHDYTQARSSKEKARFSTGD